MLPLLACCTTAALYAPRVAVVTGATRGIGRGIAIELGRAGYTVYTVGRSTRARGQTTERAMPGDLDLTVESAAEAVSEAGGVGVPLACDFRDDGEIEKAIESVRSSHGRLDVLVCSAYTTPPGSLRADFWTQGLDMWDACNGVGLRSVYATCLAATPLMIDTAKANGEGAGAKPPLVALVSSFGGKSYTFNVAYGVGKAAVDRLGRDMSYQLKKVGVATTVLYPGIVKTEGNLQLEAEGRRVPRAARACVRDTLDQGHSRRATKDTYERAGVVGPLTKRVAAACAQVGRDERRARLVARRVAGFLRQSARGDARIGCRGARVPGPVCHSSQQHANILLIAWVATALLF
eukprot:2833151-Prymnesium_polylepis.1